MIQILIGTESSSSSPLKEDKGIASDIIPADGLWPLLLTWFNFNPSMDK